MRLIILYSSTHIKWLLSISLLIFLKNWQPNNGISSIINPSLFLHRISCYKRYIVPIISTIVVVIHFISKTDPTDLKQVSCQRTDDSILQISSYSDAYTCIKTISKYVPSRDVTYFLNDMVSFNESKHTDYNKAFGLFAN